MRDPQDLASDPRVMELEAEGIIDDIQDLIAWRPVVGMAYQLQRTQDMVGKLVIARDIAALVIRLAFGRDPYKIRLFLLATLALDTIQEDARWRKVVLALIDES